MSQFRIAIIGAGPAGLSAAARAESYWRESGSSEPDYVLLEGHSSIAKTIHAYQKGKHVMAEPSFLALRSDMPFTAGTREQILSGWTGGLEEQAVNVRLNAEVSSIEGSQGGFTIHLGNSESVTADHVVMSVGTQGNPRTLGVSGERESGLVSYSLEDAGAFEDLDIVVVGAGDAAIENAIALAAKNRVTIVNRRAEFSRAKDGNLNAILKAINDPGTSLSVQYEAGVAAVEAPDTDGLGAIVLKTPGGEQHVACHMIIARLGSVPPRAFVEGCGIPLAEGVPNALPDLDRRYQSAVPGLYVIGALGGYPLIKQAMNQGYEVVDFIYGKDTKPADYPLLAGQFGGLPYAMDPEDVLSLYQQRVPMFRHMNPLAFRELIIESRILYADEATTKVETLGERQTVQLPAGHVLYRDGEHSSTFYTLVEGAARLQLEQDGPWYDVSPGQFFGEMSLISGRPREGSAMLSGDSILIETPRRIMVKLMASNEDIREGIDRVFVIRALLAAFRTRLGLEQLTELAGKVSQHSLEAGDTLYREGEDGSSLYLLRRGRVALSRGDDVHVVNQLRSGELVGQLALMGYPRRQETAIAAVRTEALEIRQDEFLQLVGQSDDYLPVLQQRLTDTLKRSNSINASGQAAETLNFMIRKGMGEATNALLIDETLCIGCDNCERACAETHNGIARVRRRADESKNNWHMAQACQHCELPHCMKDCPPDAIRRLPSGEVFITDACIGCGNCESNCPYNAISLRYPAAKKPGLFSWLLFGLGSGPGDTASHDGGGDAAKVAVKCDACMNLPDGYACVNACPTGAAIRVDADGFIDRIRSS